MWNEIFFAAQHKQDEESGKDSHWGPRDRSRQPLSASELTAPEERPRILLVDDDPTFGRIMARASDLKDIAMTCCKSIDDLAALNNWNFDVIIMDYDLGAVTGFELTKYLENFTDRNIPVVLVSGTKPKGGQRWPVTIREFVHKSCGAFAILDAAFEAHAGNKFRNIMTKKGEKQ